MLKTVSIALGAKITRLIETREHILCLSQTADAMVVFNRASIRMEPDTDPHKTRIISESSYIKETIFVDNADLTYS